MLQIADLAFLKFHSLFIGDCTILDSHLPLGKIVKRFLEANHIPEERSGSALLHGLLVDREIRKRLSNDALRQSGGVHAALYGPIPRPLCIKRGEIGIVYRSPKNVDQRSGDRLRGMRIPPCLQLLHGVCSAFRPAGNVRIVLLRRRGIVHNAAVVCTEKLSKVILKAVCVVSHVTVDQRILFLHIRP